MDPASAFSFDMSYCGSPPTLDTLLGRWNLDPVLLLVLVTLALGAAVVLRRADRYRQLAFGGAWLLALPGAWLLARARRSDAEPAESAA